MPALITVKVIQSGQKDKLVSKPAEGTTIEDVLTDSIVGLTKDEVAGIRGESLMLNAAAARPSAMVKDHDVITIAPDISGGE